ncbi:hypothetical protein GGR50DRAFT_485852 [Xylaria sp. CBS 124048]|nr:hypothetical protein GGR50DRAFT_485852 [Xylaria sp. CBS 124048]
MANQTPESTRRNAVKRSAADDVIEDRVKGAVQAYQRGQYRSIRAAATAFDAPYHRTRSRCQGHHSRGQNGGNSTARDREFSDRTSRSASPGASSRRNRRDPGPFHALPPTHSTSLVASEAPMTQSKPHQSARPVPSSEFTGHSSTNDLLRELLKRLNKQEATIRTDTASPEKSLLEKVSTHMAQQENRIGNLEREIAELMAGMTEQAKEIKFLRLSLGDRFDTLRADFRLLRKTLDNKAPL